MHYYSFHIGDYATQTRHLNLIEDLAYRRMLDLYYRTEKPLPLDPERIARLIGMRDHMQEIFDVLSDFFLKSEEGYTNKRCDAEIAQYQAKAEHARKIGKLGGRPRKTQQVPEKTSQVSFENLEETPKQANQEPITNNQEPITNNQEKHKTFPPGAADASPPPHSASKASRGSRLPDDWVLPTEWAMWAMKERPKLTVQALRTIADEFRDYWISVPARKGTKLDWFATWRNHVRRTRPAPSPSRFFDGLAYVNRHATLPDDDTVDDDTVIEH